jgi:hypothetical protein
VISEDATAYRRLWHGWCEYEYEFTSIGEAAFQIHIWATRSKWGGTRLRIQCCVFTEQWCVLPTFWALSIDKKFSGRQGWEPEHCKVLFVASWLTLTRAEILAGPPTRIASRSGALVSSSIRVWSGRLDERDQYRHR